MDVENLPQRLKEISENFEEYFKNKPTKDVFEKCLFDIILEKNKIMSNPDYDKNQINKLDNIIESIQAYLSIASE